MDLPDIDPREEILFNTRTLAKRLHIGYAKLYKYLGLAGLKPIMKQGDRAKYYTYEQAQELIKLIFTSESIWKIIRENRRKSKELEEQEL